jgi:archaetidylinositol phosphate synthase
MLEMYCRPLYQKFAVNRVAQWISKRGVVKPYHVSLAALTLGLLVPGYCDCLDGTLARCYQQSSPNGTVLDILCDRAVEFAVMLGLFMQSPETRGIWVIGMLGATLLCVTSFLVVGIFSVNTSEKSFHYSPGLIERAEAFLFFLMMMWMPSQFSGLALLYIVLVTGTAFHRALEFNRQH